MPRDTEAGHTSAEPATAARDAAVPDFDFEAEHDPERAESVSDMHMRRYAAKDLHIAVPDRKSGSGKATERVRGQIELLSGHTELVAARMSGPKATMDRDEINALRTSLDAERMLLTKSVKHLPAGSPLIAKAHAASERAMKVSERLADFANAKDAHAAVHKDFEATDGTDHYKNVREQNDGFCDRAPQEVPPCALTPQEREKRRGEVRAAVSQLAANWRQAITTKYVEEIFKKKQVTFEEQLGQLLFNVLFGVLGSGIKALVSKGIDKVGKGLSAYQDQVQISGPSSSDITLAKDVANKAIDKGTAKVEEKLTGSMTAQQLAAQAAQAVSIPADRTAFLASLENIPSIWETNINQRLLKDLFDDDLMMLADVLPIKAQEMLPTTFKEKIEEQLHRFEQQVLAVDTAPISETRPIQVITGHGPVKWALARPEMKANKSLHGEWNGTPTRTGKWTFVRWIDDDMKAMAVGRAMRDNAGRTDATGGAWMRLSTDASFWDEQSLQDLTKAGDATEHSPGGLP